MRRREEERVHETESGLRVWEHVYWDTGFDAKRLSLEFLQLFLASMMHIAHFSQIFDQRNLRVTRHVHNPLDGGAVHKSSTKKIKAKI